MVPSSGHISAPLRAMQLWASHLAAMTYGAETCYLGAEKKGQIAKVLGRCQYVILRGTGSI
jgi:hypothetical protein